MVHPEVGLYGHPFAETSGQAAYRKGLYSYPTTTDPYAWYLPENLIIADGPKPPTLIYSVTFGDELLLVGALALAAYLLLR